MTRKIDLLRVQWRSKQHSATFEEASGDYTPVAEYVLNDGAPAEKQVRLIVPVGNEEVVDFVVRCLQAGQNLLYKLPSGVKFKPNEAMPTIVGGKPQ